MSSLFLILNFTHPSFPSFVHHVKILDFGYTRCGDEQNKTSKILFSVSYPRGDIFLQNGSESIDLYCHLNPHHAYFKKVGEISST